MCCRKARLRLTNLPPRDGRQAPSGVASLWATFLWPNRESGSGAAGARKLFALIPRWRDADAMTSFAVVKLLLPSQE